MDHAGGNEELVKNYNKPSLIVYGGDDRIGALTNKVKHGDRFKLGSLQVECLFTPCHTIGHICYHVIDEQTQNQAVFTGDTLFIGGCGRFFEGNPSGMFKALILILSRLPDNTKVYCGHEYTVKNLQFAKQIEPDNKTIDRKLAWAQKIRHEDKWTVPSTIGDEKSFNPFMRVETSKTLQNHAGSTDPVEVMAFIRNEKDNF